MITNKIAIENLPWAEIAIPLAKAEDSLARLDERLAKSKICEGWIARTHFSEACASMWVEGELVHIEDLVLHDARMDVRMPTPELTRAHAILRTRRRIAEAPSNWPMSSGGLATLLGRAPPDSAQYASARHGHELIGEGANTHTDPEIDLADAFAAIDAAMARVDRAIAREPQRSNTSPRDDHFVCVRDQSDDEEADLRAWQSVATSCQSLPPTLAAAVVSDAWDRLTPVPHMPWLGRMFAASVLRERGKSRWHMPCLHEGLKAIERDRRRSQNPTTRLIAQLDAITAAAIAGIGQHDRWLTARDLLARKLSGRRSTSHLPALLDYVLTRPIVSTKMIADKLNVTPRAAQDLVADLGLRELTGRGRYRGWGIL